MVSENANNRAKFKVSPLNFENEEGYTNRYYIMTSPNARNFDLIKARFDRVAEARQLTHQVLSWTESPIRPIALIEAAVTDEEHEWVMSQNRITYIGARDPETGFPDEQVTAYLEANAADWSTPKG